MAVKSSPFIEEGNAVVGIRTLLVNEIQEVYLQMALAWVTSRAWGGLKMRS